MAVDDIQLMEWFAQDLGRLQADVVVTGAVHAIATDAVLGIHGVGQGIEIGTLRHALVKGGVEHRNIRQRRKRLLGGPDPDQVGRVVQRSQGDAGLDAGNHLLVDDHGASEFFAPMHDAMAYREKVFKWVRFLGQDLVDDETQCFVVGCTGPEIGSLFLCGRLPLDAGFRQVQAFCQPREFFFAAGGINHGEFEG